MNEATRLLASYAANAPRLGPSGPNGRIVEVGGGLPETGFVIAVGAAIWAAIQWAAVNIGLWIAADEVVDLLSDDDDSLAAQPMEESDWTFWDVRLDTLEAYGNGLLTNQRRWAWRLSVEKARKARNEKVSRLDADMLLRELRQVALPTLVEQEAAAKASTSLGNPSQAVQDQAYQAAVLGTAAEKTEQSNVMTWFLLAAGVALAWLATR